VAIKMAMQATGRSKLMTVRGGYHGDTFGAMAVCDPVNGMHHLFTGALPQHVFADLPPAVHDPEYLDRLDGLVTPDLAAVIVEPIVQGAGGMRFYHPSVLRRLRELTTERDVLLIADEIATGFGRTGELFGCDHAAVRPDIMCLGKALTGGYMTLAATLCTAEVAGRIGVLMHGPTYMGNPLATAVANASLDLLEERPWREEVKRIESTLREGLAGRNSRVMGAIGVIEMPDPVDVPRVQQIAMEHGVWLRPFGRLIYTMPPYGISQPDLSRVVEAMVSASERSTGR
jgi:adenosylmethionine---8-amino-7-oxononanoate aminotransferase